MDEELGDTVACKGELQHMTESRFPWECPGVQSPGNSVVGNAASRTL